MVKSDETQKSDFESLESLANGSNDYFKGGQLYLINASKTPEPYQADSAFLDPVTKQPKKQTNFKIEILDLESGEFQKIGAYGQIYKEMIKQLRNFREAGIALPRYKEIELLPYVRKVIPKAVAK